MGEEVSLYLKSIIFHIPLSFLTTSPSWVGTTSIHDPRGSPQCPKASKNATEITRSQLACLFIGKEGNSHLKSVTCLVPVICPTPSTSWGCLSPIHHPRGPPQIPKASKNATEIIKSYLARSFMGKEGNSLLKSTTCKVPVICLTLSSSWGGTALFHDPRGPSQSPKGIKNATKITRSH